MQGSQPRLVAAIDPSGDPAEPADGDITLPVVSEGGRSASARLCNEHVDGVTSPREQALLIDSIARKIEELFDVLRVDYVNDHNTRDTPRRVAKMLVHETLSGRYAAAPEITEFENAQGFDNLIVTGPIELRSTCAHHLMPIYGDVFVGILPARDGKIIGLSKYDRIVAHFGSRLQIQEELVKQIGNFIVEKTAPRGLAVRIGAVHMCKTHRGVRAPHTSRMVNTAYFGEMSADRSLQNAFLQECLALGRG